MELAQAVLPGVSVRFQPDHCGIAIHPRNDDDAVLIPRQQRGFGANAKVLMNPADWFTSTILCVEKPSKLFRNHPPAVIGDGPAIDVSILDRLPLDAKLAT